MNAENKVTIQFINTEIPGLSLVIQDAMGNPSPSKILEIIKSYDNPGHEILGAFVEDNLVGMLGFVKTNAFITIRHISLLQKFQKQNIGTLLIHEVKKYYPSHSILAETDEESVGFYTKLGFTCRGFKGPYGNIRYRCELYQK